MFGIDINTLNVAKGLALLIITNITLGSIDALLTQEFNWKKFFQGLIKGLVVVVCFMMTYYAGSINADIVAFNINGQDLNLMGAIYTILLIAYGWYGWGSIEKLAKMINAKYNIGEGK